MTLEHPPLTDLTELARDVLTKSPSDGLPCNLTDSWLHRIARDLDACWPDQEATENRTPYMVGPLALVLHLLHGKNGASHIELNIKTLELCFQRYRLEVALELISRGSNLAVEPATLLTIFDDRSVNVCRVADWKPQT